LIVSGNMKYQISSSNSVNKCGSVFPTWKIAEQSCSDNLNTAAALRAIKKDELLVDECTDQYMHDAINRLQKMVTIPIESLMDGYLV
jgi:hypothetical protein